MFRRIGFVFMFAVLLISCAPPPPAPSWARGPDDETLFGGEGHQGMSSIVSGGPGLVAVGYDSSLGSTAAAVWTSVDGLTWTRVPHDETVFGGDSRNDMGSIAVGGPGLVAVGSDWSPYEDRCAPMIDSDAAVWTSVDGLTWTRVPHDETIFGGEGWQSIRSIVAGGPGLVAVGVDSCGGDADAAVWTSVDGLTWTRVPHDETIFGGVSMSSIAAGGPGLVAVGWEASDDDSDAAVWTSVDGLTWTRVSHDETIFGGEGWQSMISIVAGGPGLVAVGWEASDDDSDAAVWTSVDGLTWTRVPHDETIFGGEGWQSMTSIVAGGPGLVAVGLEAVDDDHDAAVWTSVDGLTWTRVPDDGTIFGGEGNQQMTAIAVGGPGLVAVGIEYVPGLENEADGALWVYKEP